MELDELKLVWQSLDRRLELSNRLVLADRRERQAARARRALRPLAWGQVVHLLAGVAMCVLFAPFWVKYWQTPHLLLCGVLLHAYAVVTIAAAARELGMVRAIDYGSPIVTIQKQLATLRKWRVRQGLAFGVVWCFLWIPLTLVVFKWLGADVWVNSPSVVYWFLASGVVCLAVLGGLALRVRRRSDDRGRTSLERHCAGGSLLRAERVLDEIAEFERE